MMMKCQFHWWRKPEYPEETIASLKLPCDSHFQRSYRLPYQIQLPVNFQALTKIQVDSVPLANPARGGGPLPLTLIMVQAASS